jgi:mRNA interferase HigB
LGDFDDIKIAFFINTQNFWAYSCVHYWNDISTNEIKFHILKVLFIFVTKSGFVVVISYRTIREYIDEHGDVEDQLNNWYKIAEKSDWANFSEVKQMFNSVDAVGNDLYVFNIKGNNYRLIVRIIFRVRTIYIKFIGTHKEYDKVILDDL